VNFISKDEVDAIANYYKINRLDVAVQNLDPLIHFIIFGEITFEKILEFTSMSQKESE
jgi:hypothetical protein